MATFDDLYARGVELYRAREYAAAEQVFRQALATSAPPDSASLARASYGLGISVMRLGRSDEARAAFHAALSYDPTLERAGQRLAELDAEQPHDGTSTLEGYVVGVASNVRYSVSPHAVISTARNHTLELRLSFPGDPVTPVVTMTGPKLVGRVENGDDVGVPDSWRPGSQPSHLLNLSTGDIVRPTRRWTRWAQALFLAASLVLIAAFIAFVWFRLISGGPSR